MDDIDAEELLVAANRELIERFDKKTKPPLTEYPVVSLLGESDELGYPSNFRRTSTNRPQRQ